jgi:hypothetical protein
MTPLFSRQPRDMAELMNDPQFFARAWRLIGFSEMISYWLMQQQQPEAIEFGNRLGGVVSWFFVDKPIDEVIAPRKQAKQPLPEDAPTVRREVT